MSILQAIVLGFVQGISEFFPVSSSGHLIIIPRLFGWPDQGLSFDVIVHLGTLGALLWYFRDTLLTIIRRAWRAGPERKLARRFSLQIIAASIPAFIFGYLLRDIEETFARHVPLVAFNLAFWGVILWLADRYSRRVQKPSADVDGNLSWRQALTIGSAQVLALLPGTSRSGITISTGLFNGLSRAAAARFSFLLSIPITAAAGAHGVLTLIRSPDTLPAAPLVLLIGFATAALTGTWAIKCLLNFVAKQSYDLFVAYRLLLAGTLLWFF